MAEMKNFTQGKIFSPLFRFALPIMLAMFLQAMYGAVDLMIIGQFTTSSAVAAIATGGQIMFTANVIINGLAIGLTVLLGQKIGEGKLEESGKVIGSGVCIFFVLAVVLTLFLTVFTEEVAVFMHAPEESFQKTIDYTFICGLGLAFIVAYNVFGAIFRGIGDAKTPLLTVSIACLINIVLDLLLIVVFKMEVAGAAIATIVAQAISVILSIAIVRKAKLPFQFRVKDIGFHKSHVIHILKYGAPIALQDGLVHLSFLAITVFVNMLGVVAAAGLGVAARVTGFIMLVPGSLGQALAVFVAQNYGARQMKRAKKGLFYTISVAFSISIVISYCCFFNGYIFTSLFTNDQLVVYAGWDYMKAYAIDVLNTSFLFTCLGFFSGCGRSTFVMIQGIFAAFCIRIPISYYMSSLENPSLFSIGLATPIASFVQIILCILFYRYLMKNLEKQGYNV